PALTGSGKSILLTVRSTTWAVVIDDDSENSDVLPGTNCVGTPSTPIDPATIAGLRSVAVATILSPLATLAAGVKVNVFEPAVKSVAAKVSKPKNVCPSWPSTSALKNSTRSG